MVMEILTLNLKQAINDSSEFKYHKDCEKLKIVNLCFADDLSIFCNGDPNSVKVIANSLKSFAEASGSIPNLAKSQILTSNISEEHKNEILKLLPLEECHLPVNYLEIPLISSNLKVRDCKVLVERVENKLQNWKNKNLSMAGRLQLISSVLLAMQIYWASVFIISPSITKDIERKIRELLWTKGRGKAKISWKECCLPKCEGGIGIKKIKYMNKALISSLIWRLITKKKSIWVLWMYEYRIRDRNFWDLNTKWNVAASWRMILKVREEIRQFVWSRIGNGEATNVWFENWHNSGVIHQFISYRDIAYAGFDRNMVVKDIIEEGEWRWPRDWSSERTN